MEQKKIKSLNKTLRFLNAYTNPSKHIAVSCTRQAGKITAHNLLSQMNFANIERRVIAQHIKDPANIKGLEAMYGMTLSNPPKPITPQVVQIKKTTGGGSFYSADCPSCGTIKILGSELTTKTAVCNKCYTTFKLSDCILQEKTQ
jgi:hypothetical protein